MASVRDQSPQVEMRDQDAQRFARRVVLRALRTATAMPRPARAGKAVAVTMIGARLSDSARQDARADQPRAIPAERLSQRHQLQPAPHALRGTAAALPSLFGE